MLLKTWITISHSDGLLGQEVGNSLKLDSLCKKTPSSQAGGLGISLVLPGCGELQEVPSLWQGAALLFTLLFCFFCQLTPLMHFILRRTKARTNFATLQARDGFCCLKMNTPGCLHGCMSSSPPCCSLRWLGTFILWSICSLK